MATKVFVSSVGGAFSPYRDAAVTSIKQVARDTEIDFVPVYFEDWPSSNRPSYEECMLHVNACPIFLAIAGAEYGTEYEEVRLSYSHAEFRRARDAGDKMIYAFIQGGVERDERQVAFVRELETVRFHAKEFHGLAELQLEIERTLRTQSGATWSERARERALGFMDESFPALRARLWPSPVLAIAGFPACSVPEFIHPQPVHLEDMLNSDAWYRFVGGSSRAHGIGRVNVDAEGHLISDDRGYPWLNGIGRFSGDGGAVVTSRGATASYNPTRLMAGSPVPAAEAERVYCSPEQAQHVINAGVELLGSFWKSHPRISGQALVSVQIDGTERMVLLHGDLTSPNFLGPVPPGYIFGPEPPGVLRILKNVWTTVDEVVWQPKEVARKLVGKVWEAFRYPRVANWIQELLES